MTSPDSLVEQIKPFDKIPPVDQWHPPLSGDIDIRIDREGNWYHQGEKIQRQSLVRLFASILWFEEGEYYLVTPVEKWRIRVDVAPLLVVSMNVDGKDHKQQVSLSTSTGDQFVIDRDHPLTVDRNERGEPLPLVRVRYRLDALIHRNVFYELADLALQHPEFGWGIWSGGEFWTLT